MKSCRKYGGMQYQWLFFNCYTEMKGKELFPLTVSGYTVAYLNILGKNNIPGLWDREKVLDYLNSL